MKTFLAFASPHRLPLPARVDVLFLLLVNGALIAGVYAFGKIAGGADVSALALITWQVAFAAVVVGVIAAIRGEAPRPTWANLRYAAVAGLLGLTGPYFISFLALAHLPTGLVGAITALSPVFTYALVVMVRMERLQLTAAFGIALGFVGAVGIALTGASLTDAMPSPWILPAVAAPLLLAAGNVFRTLAWPPQLKPLAAASLTLTLQALLLVPLAVVTGQFRLPRGLSSDADIALLGAGVLMAGFFLGAFELQKRGGPVVVGQLSYVIATVSLAIGVLAFGERYTVVTLLALATVLIGVTLVNQRRLASAGGQS